MAAKIFRTCIKALVISIVTYFTCPEYGFSQRGDKTNTVPIDIKVDGKLFHATKNSYWRENYNAHSYYVIVLSFIENNQVNEIIPLLDQNKLFVDTLIDAPGSDCFRKNMQFLEYQGSSYLIILQNSDTMDRVTSIQIYKAAYNEEELPGLPLLYFEFVQDDEIPKTCNPAGVYAGFLFKQIKHK